MRVETERIYLYPLSDEEMRLVIEKESDNEMKQAYTEMLEGSLSNPDKRIWYAIWNMELNNDPKTIAGDFCFKGLGDDGVVEIGYGLKEEYRHHGYMTEAVKAITEWALSQEGVKIVQTCEQSGSTEITVTHNQIARDINTAREVVARMIKRLAKEGMLRAGRGKIYVTDPNMLKKLCLNCRQE